MRVQRSVSAEQGCVDEWPEGQRSLNKISSAFPPYFRAELYGSVTISDN